MQYIVTVITVTRNAVCCISRCTQSVAQQVLPDGMLLEHLIIDGVSTDGTLDFLEKWSNLSQHHRFISEPDNGLYDAMNKGVQLAKGEIIVFLNADDQFSDAKVVERSIQPILDGKCDYTCAPASMVRKDGVFLYIQIPDLSLPYLNHPFNTQTLFVKRLDFLDLGGHDLSYKVAADDEFDCKLIKAGKIGCVLKEISVIAQDGGFGVTHYYAHERARLLYKYKENILSLCSRNKFYAFEFFLALMRISKVHPVSAKVDEKWEAAHFLNYLHTIGFPYWPFFCQLTSKLTCWLVIRSLTLGYSVKKMSWKNVLISLSLRLCIILYSKRSVTSKFV